MKYVVTWAVGLRIEADSCQDAAGKALSIMRDVNAGSSMAIFGIEDESGTLHRVQALNDVDAPAPTIDPMLAEFFPGYG